MSEITPIRTEKQLQTAVEQLAQMGLMQGMWSANRVLEAQLERSGSYRSPDFDHVTATFRALKDYQEGNGFYSRFIIQLTGSRLLVHEELPDFVRANLESAIVSLSQEEIIIATPKMLEEAVDDETYDDRDDADYRFERSVEYRILGSGQIHRYVSSEGYFMNDEEASALAFVDPGIEISTLVGIEEGFGYAAPDPDWGIQQLENDVSFLEFITEYQKEFSFAGQSYSEHMRRLTALIALFNYQSNATRLVHRVFEK